MTGPEETAARKEQRRKHNDKMKRYYERHPEQRRKKIDRIRARYSTDEAYREAVKARARDRRLSRTTDSSADSADLTGGVVTP